MEEIKRKRGRPRKYPEGPPKPERKKPLAPVSQEEDLIGGPENDEDETDLRMDIAEVYGGVSGHWLSQIFGHDKNTIKKKLAAGNCEVVGYRNGGPLYRIAEAAQWLVKPKVDLVSYVKSLRPNDLPPMLNDAYWGAMLKRQKWEENAGDLWRTEAVLEVFGDLALSFKTTVSLWVEEVDRQQSLTPEQRAVLTGLCDDLLERVYQQMVEAPKKRRTPSSVVEEGGVQDLESLE